MPRPEAAILHLVTDHEVCGRAGFVEMATRAMAAGGGRLALHLRMPTASGRAVYQLASTLRPIAARSATALVVNDRLDAAMAVRADGVQLGGRSLSLAHARRILPAGFGVGVSLHAGDAVVERADWLLAGNVFATDSHPGRPGAGIAMIRALAAGGARVMAIGGVVPGRVAELRSAGAAGVAVIRGVWNAADPAAAVERYLKAWERNG